MNAEDLVVNDCCKGQVIEDLSAISPHIDRTIFSKTFVVETVHLGDLATLVIASD